MKSTGHKIEKIRWNCIIPIPEYKFSFFLCVSADDASFDVESRIKSFRDSLNIHFKGQVYING